MKRGPRILLWIGAALAVLVIAFVLTGWAFFHTFYPSQPEANFPPANDVATAQRQDFQYFRHYFDLNRTFTAEARARAEKMRVEYESKAGTLSPAQFDLAIASMVALADNGHSRVHPFRLSTRHTRIPCRTYRFADGYYVLRARPACAELLGAQILGIEGHAINEVADRMFTYFGGPRNHYDQFASPFFLESPELLNAAGIAASPDRLTMHVKLRDNSERDVEIAAEPPNADVPWESGDEFLSPQPLENEAKDWQPLLARDAALPTSLRDFNIPFRSEYWQDRQTYYVQFRSNADEEGHSIGEFCDKVRADIVAHRPRFIVLDLRFNQGGNLTTTASLMKNLTKLTDSVQHIYTLTSAWTFSAGITSVGLAKEHAGPRLTIIGETIGDRLRFWGEGRNMELPNSKLAIGYSTGMHDYSRPCTGEPGCFWIMRFLPMHMKSREPDIRVPYTFDDYVNLRDPFMDRALELLDAARQ